MMDSWILLNIILNLLTLINTILTIFICFLIFILILIFHRRIRSVPILLAGHTCVILIFSAFMLSSMSSASLAGFLNIPLQQHQNTPWCRIRGFLVHGFLCVLYDSYILQAGYRLCRVVFYRQKILHNFRVYLVFIPFEYVCGLLSISPALIHHHVIYLPSEYYCQTPFTNLRAIIYICLRLFLLPIIFISFVYIYLSRHIHRRKAARINKNGSLHRKRTKQNKKHLIITRRLFTMIAVLILLGLPSVAFLSIYIFTGSLHPLTYRIGWLSVSFSLVFLACMLIQLTTPLKKTVRKLLSRPSTSRGRAEIDLE